MTNRKAIRRARRIRRTVLTVCLMALVAVISIGATVAYLTAKTGTIKNTFTVGDINLTLVEHKYDTTKPAELTAVEVSANQDYPLIPGTTYAKDPTVTIKGNNVSAYVFVKFEEINNPSTYLTYDFTLDTNVAWKKLESETTANVWYATVTTNETGESWSLLDENKVVVKNNIIDADAKDATGAVKMPTEAPELKFTAYACQSGNLTVEQAWNEVKDLAD